MPFHFGQSAISPGFAAESPTRYAENRKMFQTPVGLQKLADMSWELWRRLDEIREKNSEARFKLIALRPGGNVGDSPATVDDKTR